MATAFFYINLDRDGDRSWHMQRSASALGMSFRRVAAVDLATLKDTPPAGFRPHRFSNERWTLRPFEIAVFESHRKAWAAFLATSDDLGVIMEDDMLFAPSFAETVEMLEATRSTFDIVKLNHSAQPRLLGQPLVNASGLDLRPIDENIADAGCYMLSRRAAEILMDQSRTYCAHLDDFVFSPDRRLRSLQLIPPVAAQMIYLEAPTRTLTTISTRLEQTDRAAKGPFAFRAWKEIRRLAKNGLRRVKSRAKRGEVVDFPALLDDFRPMPT